ncbi:MAG: hypothetical protein WBV82_29990, partial [Myxococcaceae bacterium]
MYHWKLLTVLLVPVLAAGCSESNNPPPPVEADIQTYAVGGVVSGLVGSGLALKLNDGDPISATSAPFTFPNRMTSGTAYTVSVVGQPVGPAQECTLTNASGTVGTSDITDVQVTCPPPLPGTFTLGGMVANLEGSGLRLNVN